MIRVLRLIYDVGMLLVVAGILVPVELLKIAAGRSSWRDLAQRLAFAAPSLRPDALRVLIHAVSVGEVAAAGALVAAIHEREPAARFVITTGNRRGREAGERLRTRVPAIETVRLLPWDRHRALRRWLAALAPDAVVVVETELWPNLFRTCRELDIPLFIVNGRLYPGDVARYRLARRFFADVLGGVRWIGTVDTGETEAFLRIGAPARRIEALGNLKFDSSVVIPELPRAWRDALAERPAAPLVLAASTHPPEERMLLDALVSLRRRFPALRFVLAPRRAGRCERLARLAASRALTTARWSRPEPAGSGWDVLLIDEFGVLPALVAYADAVFVGGSIAPRGGHNPLEAAAGGRPIVMGPSITHFRIAVEELAAAGALALLPAGRATGDGLEEALARLLADRGLRVESGQRGLAYVAARRGVADRYAAAVLSRLGPLPSRS
jgi:3-deoxy-D-manno-octulosonic-acid transferase